MRHTISVLVENEFGVLSRVSGLFSGRGFNIESLCVAETMDPKVSRMTLVTSGNDQIVEQILKQLNKLVPVLKVIDFTGVDTVDRELVLVKVNADGEGKPEVLRKGFAAEGPVLIDVTVDPGELVYPMVPAGASLTEMLLV